MTGRMLEAVTDKAMEMIIRHCVRMQIGVSVDKNVIPELTVYYNTKTHTVTDHKTGSKYQCAIAVCDIDWYSQYMDSVEDRLAKNIYSPTPELVYNDRNWCTRPARDIIWDALTRGDITCIDFMWYVDVTVRNRMYREIVCDYGEPLRETILEADESEPPYDQVYPVNPTEC